MEDLHLPAACGPDGAHELRADEVRLLESHPEAGLRAKPPIAAAPRADLCATTAAD